MKIAPVSGNLVVELAIGAAIIGLLYLASRKVGDDISALANAAGDAVDAVATGVNPTSTQNYVYRATNAVGNVLAPNPDSAGKNADGSWSLGGWLYDVTH